MPHRLPRLFVLWALAGSGCSIENPSFQLHGDGHGGSTGPPTTGDASTSGAATTAESGSAGNSDGMTGSGGSSTGGEGSTAAVTSTTSEPGTSTGDVSGTTGTSGGGSTGADSIGGSTGGVNECVGGALGEPPRLEVKKSGQVLMACGASKSVSNAFAKFSGSTLQIYDSGTCTQTGTLYEVTGVNFTITPIDLGESCSHVTLEWAAAAPCEVTGFALKNGDNPAYVGAFGRRTGPGEYAAFSVEPFHECGCAVDDVACCKHFYEIDQKDYLPGEYSLGFPDAVAPIAAMESTTGKVEGADYLFTNLRSLVHESCAAEPSHVWLDFRWWAMLNN